MLVDATLYFVYPYKEALAPARGNQTMSNTALQEPETYSQSKDLAWFIAHQDDLVDLYNGKTLLIRHTAVEGVYDVEFDAFTEGLRRFPPGTFSVQLCIPGEGAYSSNVYTIEAPYQSV